MDMLTPYEVYVKKIIPYIKAIIAIKLVNERKLTQIEVARLLGVTQAAISQYLSKGEEHYIKTLEDLGLDREAFIYGLEKVVSEVDSVSGLISFFNDLWYKLLFTRRICSLHKRYNILLNECNVCMTSFIGSFQVKREKEEIIEELEKVFSILSKIPEFRNLIPEVYTNMVRAIPNPVNVDDVAAFPGRIIPTSNGIKVVGKPMFGCSRHLAKVLINVNRLYPYVLAAINIKFNEEIKRAVELAKLQYVYSEVDSIRDEDSIIQGIVRALEKYGFKPIIFDRGGGGFEPNTYILGKDLFDVLDKVVSILWGLRIGAKR